MTPKHTTKLRNILKSALTAEVSLPKFDEWDATNPEALAAHLNDRTPWIVVCPSQVDLNKVPAIWLVAQGLAIPESLWSVSLPLRMWVFSNAWRVAFVHMLNSNKTTNQLIETQHLREDHPEGMGGFRVLRVHALSQKDAVLGAVRRSFMEMLHRTGSLSAVDSANAISNGSQLKTQVVHRQASIDAIDKAVLFIGTQCNWVKNPAFLRPAHLGHPAGTEHYEFDSIWYDYQSIKALIEEAFVHAQDSLPAALGVVDHYIGTTLFGWSLIHAATLDTLPGTNTAGAFGNGGSLARIVTNRLNLGELNKDFGCGNAAYTETQGPLVAYSLMHGAINDPIILSIVSGGIFSYFPFARTWRGELTPRAYRALVKKDASPIPVIALGTDERFFRQVRSIPASESLIPPEARTHFPLLFEK